MSLLVDLEKGKRPPMWSRDCLPVTAAIDLPASSNRSQRRASSSAYRTAQRRMWAAPLPLPIRLRSRHISIAEPEPQIPPNSGDNHIVGEPTLRKQWISELTRFSHSPIVAIRLEGANGT